MLACSTTGDVGLGQRVAVSRGRAEGSLAKGMDSGKRTLQGGPMRHACERNLWSESGEKHRYCQAESYSTYTILHA